MTWAWLIGGMITWPVVTAIILRNDQRKGIEGGPFLAVLGGMAAGICLPLLLLGLGCYAIGYGVYRLGLALSVWPPEPQPQVGHWVDAWPGLEPDQIVSMARARVEDSQDRPSPPPFDPDLALIEGTRPTRRRNPSTIEAR